MVIGNAVENRCLQKEKDESNYRKNNRSLSCKRINEFEDLPVEVIVVIRYNWQPWIKEDGKF